MSEVDDIFREFALAFLGRIQLDKDVAFPDGLRRDLLDGTLNSLHQVDAYLDTLHKRRRKVGEPEWHTTVLWGGAYLGEVIRHETQYAFRWMDYKEYLPLHPELQSLIPERTTATCAFLVTPDGGMSMPLNKIARYIEEGREHSTHFFATCDINRVKKKGAV